MLKRRLLDAVLGCCAGMLLLLASPYAAQCVYAADTSENAQASDNAQLSQELLEELQLEELEVFLQEEWQADEPQIQFGELLQRMLQGAETPDLTEIFGSLADRCFRVLQQNRAYLVQMLVLLLAFVLLQGMSGIFSDAFLSDISFLAVYFLFLYNALRIFVSMQQTAAHCLERIGGFTLLVQPVFCMALLFSSGAGSAGFTYELLLLVLYLVQELLEKLLLPLVFVFLIIQFANYAWKEERLLGMAKLFENGIGLAQKVIVSLVLGLNVIQGMVAPALDHVKSTAAVRTLGVLPGIGGAVNAVSEMLLGTGLLIKNCVGASVLVVLVLLCVKPLAELCVLTLVYRVLAAFIEPVADKRISGVLDALARAGMLYVRLVLTAVLMLFLSVAMICAATGEV